MKRLPERLRGSEKQRRRSDSVLGSCTFFLSETEPPWSPRSAFTPAVPPDPRRAAPAPLREGCFPVRWLALGLLKGHLSPSGAVKKKQPMG